MSRYIDTEILIAEIERLKERAQAERVLHPKTILSAKNYLLIKDYDALLSFITSLQQEQPQVADASKMEQTEVDLEKEIEHTYYDGSVTDTSDMNHVDYENIARHFYELGLNAALTPR